MMTIIRSTAAERFFLEGAIDFFFFWKFLYAEEKNGRAEVGGWSSEQKSDNIYTITCIECSAVEA